MVLVIDVQVKDIIVASFTIVCRYERRKKRFLFRGSDFKAIQ
jgi:hypothetical protein